MKNSFFYKTIIISTLTAIIIKVLIIEIYNVPSESMGNTLLKGDRIVVFKIFNYGLRSNKEKELFSKNLNKPHRNDVLVFLHPDENKIYVKRCIGLPMDSILLLDKEIFINKQQLVRPISARPKNLNLNPDKLNQYLPARNDVAHQQKKDSISVNIPKDQYYLLGDNMNGSYDSRFWGSVPERNIIGKAKFILFNFRNGRFQWNRFFKRIQ